MPIFLLEVLERCPRPDFALEKEARKKEIELESKRNIFISKISTADSCLARNWVSQLSPVFVSSGQTGTYSQKKNSIPLTHRNFHSIRV